MDGLRHRSAPGAVGSAHDCPHPRAGDVALAHRAADQMGRTPEWIAWWMLWSAPQRLFFVWLYIGTGRSLFAAILLHASVNLSVSSPFLPRHGGVLDIAVPALVTATAAALVAPRLRSG
jgi:membrane protease YdiL (CAAX protease family)